MSFVAVQESGDNVSRLTTRRFMLRCERAEEFVKELKDVLENFAATRRLEEQAASETRGFGDEPGATPASAPVDDLDALSNHFALGAYGLVGN